MFTEEEIEWRRQIKREKFRRDQAAQLRYATNIGIKQGFDQGLEQGIEQGIEQGVAQGLEQGIRSTIVSLRKYHVPEQDIEKELQEQYHLSQEKIRQYMTLH